MASITKPKATPDLTKLTGGDGKRPGRVETTQTKSSNASLERSKAVSSAKSVDASQYRQRTASGTSSAKPAAATHVPARKQTGNVDEPEPEAKSSGSIPRQPRSSGQAKASVGDGVEPDAEDNSATNKQAAAETPDEEEPGDGLDDPAADDLPEEELIGEEEEEEAEDKPELETFEHDLGEVCLLIKSIAVVS